MQLYCEDIILPKEAEFERPKCELTVVDDNSDKNRCARGWADGRCALVWFRRHPRGDPAADGLCAGLKFADLCSQCETTHHDVSFKISRR